ncbi:hypothetical protein I3760_04G103300 [Carya illinoinensis]|uniref:Uncharacterized protein n=1 Tax=Carya illinoinensis TaxID=32201 RepID=A0A922JUZ6_CARIL|nr:hypothetical protein I3760_04G103300 [Carya illinoinensis]KAG6717487.1 hypothetical protein I3842_04G102600 [Carya illinoinensis]
MFPLFPSSKFKNLFHPANQTHIHLNHFQSAFQFPDRADRYVPFSHPYSHIPSNPTTPANQRPQSPSSSEHLARERGMARRRRSMPFYLILPGQFCRVDQMMFINQAL